jgi:hypothetical protein
MVGAMAYRARMREARRIRPWRPRSEAPAVDPQAQRLFAERSGIVQCVYTSPVPVDGQRRCRREPCPAAEPVAPATGRVRDVLNEEAQTERIDSASPSGRIIQGHLRQMMTRHRAGVTLRDMNIERAGSNARARSALCTASSRNRGGGEVAAACASSAAARRRRGPRRLRPPLGSWPRRSRRTPLRRSALSGARPGGQPRIRQQHGRGDGKPAGGYCSTEGSGRWT